MAALTYFSTRPPGPLLSDFFQLALILLVMFAISGAARRSDYVGRYFWKLNLVAFSLSAIVQILGAYSDLFGETAWQIWTGNLLSCFWFLPLGMALFLDSHPQAKIFDSLLVFDFIQAALLCLTAYFYFFYISSSGDPDLDLSRSVWAPYFAGYGILVVAFLLRAVLTHSAVLRALLRTTGLFLLFWGITFAFYFYGPGHLLDTGEWFDIIWSLVLLIPLLTAAKWNLAEPARLEFPVLQSRGVVATQLFPLLYPAFILVMSASVKAEWMRLAWTAVFLSFACFSARVLVTQHRLLQTQECLRREASHDGLTGVWNRVAILEILERELLRAQREGTSVGIIMADADRFKSVNDTFGHVVGDAVLQKIAHTISEVLRPYDAVGRYGGEEFLVVVPACGSAETRELAERIRLRLLGCNIPVNSANELLTLSMGVTVGNNAGRLEALLHAADVGMYAAKRQGGNRVEQPPELTSALPHQLSFP